MSFMSLYHTPKGAFCTADCDRCGATLYAHEWASPDFNEDRDALEAGTMHCSICGIGHADKSTFYQSPRPQYAARYSADGYMDCTDWQFDTNLRRLLQDTRAVYGERS
jgi:ribosomal protein L37E